MRRVLSGPVPPKATAHAHPTACIGGGGGLAVGVSVARCSGPPPGEAWEPGAEPGGGVIGQGIAASSSTGTCCQAAPRLHLHGGGGGAQRDRGLLDCRVAQGALP